MNSTKGTSDSEEELERILVDYGRFMQRHSPEDADRVKTQYRYTKKAMQLLIAQEANKAVVAELNHWARFFTDPSMNSKTPSERLQDRIKQLTNREDI